MKSTFVAALFALAVSGSAVAATSVTITVPDILDSLELGYTIQTREILAGDSFTDYYKFSLSGDSDVYGNVASATVKKRVNQVSVVVKDVVFDSITLTGTSFSGTMLNEDVTPDFLFSNLSEGSYILTVVGHATGTLGGSYHGELLASPSLVPEADSMALALAGLGIVSSLSRRRKGA
jgi:hypothetical protein